MASSSASGTVAARISAFQNRPATSLDSDGAPTRTYPRKQRSLGNLISQLDGANELVDARARLKHVGEVKKSPKRQETKNAKQPDPEHPTTVRRHRTNSSVLEELDDLLDTAIGENTTQFATTDSRDTTYDPVPDWPLPRTQSFTSKSPSKYAARHSSNAAKRRQSRQRRLRADSSDATESNTSNHCRRPSIDSNRPRSSADTDIGHYHPLLSEGDHQPVRIEVPRQFQEGKSPIKQRAALFEKLSQHEAAMVHDIPHTHDLRNPTKMRGIWPPKQDSRGKERARTEFVSSLKKDHLKFRYGQDEAPTKHSPDSPPRTSSPEKVRQTHVPPIPLALPQLVALSDEYKKPRDISYNQPLKWDIFKGWPNASIKQSSVLARAELDHNASATKTHQTQLRVHDLLVAAKEAVKVPTPETDINQQDRKSTPPRSIPGTLAETPRVSSAAEKEVASKPSATPAGSATPGTSRGRPLVQDFEVPTRSPPGEQDGTYRVEQRFALSRSRSRGGGVRVQVEIRSPKVSPERGGEHTVIVTANVEPIDEDSEAWNGAD